MFKSLRTHSVDGSVPVHLISIISVLHYVYAHQFFKITIIHYFYAHRFSKLNRLQLRLRTLFSNIIRFTSCFRFRICVRKRNSVRNPYTHSGVWYIRLRRACGGRDDVWYAGVSFEAEVRDEIVRGTLPVNPLYYPGF